MNVLRVRIGARRKLVDRERFVVTQSFCVVVFLLLFAFSPKSNQKGCRGVAIPPGPPKRFSYEALQLRKKFFFALVFLECR